MAAHKLVNPQTFLLPNGVDLGLFDLERAARSERPADLPAGGPIIGFVESAQLSCKLDLLAEVTRRFPSDHLVLIGRLMSNETAPSSAQLRTFEQLKAMPNVRVLGFKPTHQLPIYLSHFDTCLIPFRANAFNGACDPLKFYQYAAMGKPVVTTPVALTQRYPRLCYMGTTAEEFAIQVAHSMSDTESNKVSQGMLDLAHTHSWRSLIGSACETLRAIQQPPKLREGL